MSDLERILQASVARFNALPPEAQCAMRGAQRKSWVVGEMMIEHPTMTREDAERLYDEVCV